MFGSYGMKAAVNRPEDLARLWVHRLDEQPCAVCITRLFNSVAQCVISAVVLARLLRRRVYRKSDTLNPSRLWEDFPELIGAHRQPCQSKIEGCLIDVLS